MKKQNRAFPAVVCVITALLLAACFDPVGTTQREDGAHTGRVLITIAGEGEPVGTDPAAAVSRTLLPEYGVLTYTVTIAKGGTTVFTQTITTTSVTADLETGTHTISVTAKNSGDVPVAEGSGTVVVSLGVESPVTIRLGSVASGTGTLEYTVNVNTPEYPPFKGGSIAFFSLSGGTNPSSVDLTEGLTGTQNLPAGFYRAVLTVEILGKRVAQTRILHISDQTTTTAEFDFAIGDFVPAPPAGGSVLYLTNQAELEAIREHIGSSAMNYGKNAYVLLNDIALEGVWTPIGNKDDGASWASAFQGCFFGENHRITGLTFSGPEGYCIYTGLFGAVHQGLIHDLTVETASFQMDVDQGLTAYGGFVAGGLNESDLSNITVKPANLTVTRKNTTQSGGGGFGGAAGLVRNSRLREITVMGVPGSSLSFLSDPANVNWTLDIGGIAGSLGSGSEISGGVVSLDINISQTDKRVTLMLGGIAGSNGGTIRRSSYSGTLELSFAGLAPYAGTGGIAGTNGSSGTIEACYVAPLITIGSANTTNDLHLLYTGGLAGANTGTLRNSYAACGIGISVTTASTMRKNIYSGGVMGGRGATGSSVPGLVEKCYAAGSLQIAISSTIYDYDRIKTAGISAGHETDDPTTDTTASSAALLSAISGNTGTCSRIAPIGTLTSNIAFKDMLVNGAALSDAGTDPRNDVNGLGKTAAQLADQSTYAGFGWDFGAVWDMGPAVYPYPILQWQNGTPPVPPGFTLLEDA
jgi:hypothetical protein